MIRTFIHQLKLCYEPSASEFQYCFTVCSTKEYNAPKRKYPHVSSPKKAIVDQSFLLFKITFPRQTYERCEVQFGWYHSQITFHNPYHCRWSVSKKGLNCSFLFESWLFSDKNCLIWTKGCDRRIIPPTKESTQRDNKEEARLQFPRRSNIT